uniref:Uncharacterized protein n=1 Tax=Phlebotomus papatasi TaxID=29031 RepID=A0A1B0GNL2_PHLPP
MENDKVHLRHIMLYEYRKGVSVRTAQKNIAEVYLDNAPAFKTVQKWFARFRKGDLSLEDKPRAGRPSDINDSGNDLNTVWRVIVHLMGKEILEFTNNVPINAVRQLFEWPGANPTFSAPALSPERDTTEVTVRFVCRNKFMETHGFGTNKSNAKKAAAKAALQYLRKNR